MIISSNKTNVRPIFVRHILTYGLLAILLTARSAIAEPFLALLTKHQADSLRLGLSKNQADTVQVDRFIQLGQFYVYKPGEIKSDLDSAFLFYKQAFTLSKKLVFTRGEIRALYVLGAIQAEKHDEKQAELTHKTAISMSRKLGYMALEAEGWYYLGDVGGITAATTPGKIGYYTESMKLYGRMGNINKQAYVVRMIALLNYNVGNLEASLRQELEALRLYQSVGSREIHSTFSMLVTINGTMGNYKDALRYGLAAIESSREARDTADLAYYYTLVGWINEDLNQREEAIRYQKVALRKVQEARDNFWSIAITKVICLNYLLLNRPDEAISLLRKTLSKFPANSETSKIDIAAVLSKYYLYKKDYTRAEEYFLKMVDYYKIKNRNLELYNIELYENVADFYIQAGQYEKARRYLDQIVGWNKKASDPGLRGNLILHKLMFKLDSIQGNYQSAIAHYQQYKALNDSIFNTTKSNQIASIQIQYDTKKKEQDNALLRRKNQVQQASIREKDFQRNVTFVGAAMLMFLLGLSYNQYRIKQRSNARLQVKQDEITRRNIQQQHLLEEKEWLLKEIHHRVKNNLQTVMSLLESQSAYLKNDALAAIKDSQHRVQAMSLIHQKLYLSDNVTTINMQIYIQELVSYLQDSFDTRQRIRVQLDLDPIDLDIAHAIPLGLILNEAITNSIKYAFPAGMKGVITLTITQLSDAHYRFTVADNGVGLPAFFEDRKTTSLGIKLMHGLSNEIGGRLVVSSEKGTSVSVSFEIEKVFWRPTSVINEETELLS